MLRQTLERLHTALVGAVGLDDVVAGRAVFKELAQRDLRPAVLLFESRGDVKQNRVGIATVSQTRRSGRTTSPY